jgi:hypothetical protein
LVADPIVIDARGGLTQQVLDGLRGAERVSFVVRDPRTVALGYWVGDQLTIVIIESDPLFDMVRVPRQAPGLQGRYTRGTPRLRGIVADFAAESELWGRVMGALRAGDRLRLAHDPDKPGLVMLQVFAHGARLAAFRLPRRPAAQSVA